MSLFESLLTFSIAASLLTLTPGLDTALVVRQLITSGPQSAKKAALGVAAGCLIWGALVAMGLGVLLTNSLWAFTIVKTAGAVYLVWQGLQMLRRQVGSKHNQIEFQFANESSSPHAALMQGFWTNVLNPKVGIFYVTLLPQFLVPDVNASLYIFSLAVIHVLLSVLWFLALIIGGQRGIKFLQHPKLTYWTDKVTGLVLIGFGVKLFASDLPSA